ncbi:hypothetical protein GCM10022252_13220 [Streptosporangium oxazolinicum]|uniref:Secreted protein n=1 Tax=Streptosporangium oxazolinicum TaxID=909287 RepID=A0ABP8AIE5_9ACTN
MRRSLVVPVAIIGALLAVAGLAAAAVVLVFAVPDSASREVGVGASPGLVGSLPSPTPVAGTGMATVPEENPGESADEDEEEFEERLAAGRARPLKISQATRDKLAAASRAVDGPSAESARVTAGGVIYYGVVYGESEAADTYYVVALLNKLHFWTREGRGDWRFEGDYDARGCAPPVPTSMYAAWGLSFSTQEPGEYQLCRE